MSDANQLRLVIAILGALLLLGMWLFGQPRKPKQGERKPRRDSAAGERVEPTLGAAETVAADAALDPALDAELERLGDSIRATRAEPEAPELPLRTHGDLGVRPEGKIDRIVTLHVAAHPGETLAGPEIVVAAEKAGLVFGHREIFHRLVEGRPELGPVFSVASMVKPGSFDMANIAELRVPGVTFFMVLPGPASALDAWEAMLPAAQRFAERLDAQVLDEERNALGRQTIQHIRDALRAYDRNQDKSTIKRSW